MKFYTVILSSAFAVTALAGPTTGDKPICVISVVGPDGQKNGAQAICDGNKSSTDWSGIEATSDYVTAQCYNAEGDDGYSLTVNGSDGTSTEVPVANDGLGDQHFPKALIQDFSCVSPRND